jgi:hypothetical protein
MRPANRVAMKRVKARMNRIGRGWMAVASDRSARSRSCQIGCVRSISQARAAPSTSGPSRSRTVA